MSTNDRNEAFADKNDKAYFDSEGAPDGELSQDELDNVSGGAQVRMKAGQLPDGSAAFEPDGKALAARPSDDPSDRTAL